MSKHEEYVREFRRLFAQLDDEDKLSIAQDIQELLAQEKYNYEYSADGNIITLKRGAVNDKT